MTSRVGSMPDIRPARPDFSSGPCAKRPGWSLKALGDAAVGRSHRAKIGKTKLKDVIDRSKALLGLPEDWRVAIVPGSDTGAFEMAMWTMLGARGVTAVAWESFGAGWVTDAVKQLRLDDLEVVEADYGDLPDLGAIDTRSRDVLFTWNGTTSGVRVPDADWIASDRDGLMICDATSAVFAMDLPWDKLDVVTWSWQKVLGGEAAHGMIALSPRAVARLESHIPPWPVPKVFRLTKSGKLTEGPFKGETINTPSMLAVEDALDALAWAERTGGVPALIRRSEANLSALARWVESTDWIDFLASDPATRSCTSICLQIVDPWFAGLDKEAQAAVPKRITALLEGEGVAYDVNGYRDAPPGLRIWGGATVETADIEALTPWLDWAYAQVREELAKAA